MIDNQYKQFSFNFDNDSIEEQGFIHPFNEEIELEELKERYKAFREKVDPNTKTLSQKYFIFFWDIDDLLMFSPFLSNYIDQDEQDFIKLCSVRTSKEEKKAIDHKYNLQIFTALDSITKDSIEELSKNPSYNPYKYLVSFYFKEPFESFTDKISYILSLDKIEFPKKYVYDLINRKEIIRDGILSPMDKKLLHFGFNEEETWKYRYSQDLERYHTPEGLRAIKKFYDSIPYVDKKQFEEKNSHKDFLYTYKQVNFFLDVLLNPNIQERALRDPSIIDYETILKDRIERLETSIKSQEESLLEYDKTIDSILAQHNETMDSLITQQLKKNNITDKDKLIERDQRRLHLFAYSRYASKEPLMNDIIKEEYGTPKENQEDILYIKNLNDSPIDSLDFAYFEYLLKREEQSSLYINKLALRKNREEFLKNLYTPGTLEAYYQEQAKIFFSSKYHRRDNSELIDQEEREKGNIASYSNNILNIFKMDALSLRKLTPEEEEEAKELVDNIKSSEDYIKEQDTIIKGFGSFVEKDQARRNKDEEEKILAHLKESKAQKGYISFKGGLRKASYTIGSAQNLSYAIEEIGENHINIKYENDINISIPKTFLIDTLNKKKIVKTEASLEDMTSLRATRLNILTTLIIDKASNTFGNTIELDKMETLKTLGFKEGTTTIEKKGGAELRYLLGALKYRSITRAKLKTKEETEKAKGKIEYKKRDFDIGDISLISSFYIIGNKITISLDNMIKETTAKNTSKIYKPSNIEFKSPEEILIQDKALSVMNQTTYRDFGIDGKYKDKKKVSILSLMSPIHSLRTKLDSVDNNHFKRDISEPFYEYLENINKNERSPIWIGGENLEKIPYMTTREDFVNNVLELAYRESCIPQKIKHKEAKKIEKAQETKTSQKKKKRR